MRFRCFILILLLGSPLFAQNKSALLLDRINSIKLNPDRYLYACCTVANEPDSIVSKKEALAILQSQLKEFSPESLFPVDSIHIICCPLRPSRYRACAYVEKASLEAWLQERSAILRNESRQTAINGLLVQLPKVREVRQVENMLKESGISEGLYYSYRLNGEEMVNMEECYLVYYDKSGRIQEIMSPLSSACVRESLLTGKVVDPMDYTTTPFWFYVKNVK